MILATGLQIFVIVFARSVSDSLVNDFHLYFIYIRSPMRILLLIKRFNFGGSENHVRELANSLTANGHQVWICSRRGRQTERLDPQIHFHSFHLNDFKLPWQIFQLMAFMRQHNIELIHAHQRLAIKFGALLSMLLGIPVVATVHGKTRHDLGGWLLRKNLTRVIFVSCCILHRAARFKELRSKSVFIPNSIIPAPMTRNVYSDNLFYIARMDKHHSALLLMLIRQVIPELLCHVPNLTFTIIGDGRKSDIVRKACQAINQTAGRNIIRCLGFQPDPAQHFANASLLMGVGRSALLALAHGVPVLSLNDHHLGALITSANARQFMNNNFVQVSGLPPTPQRVKAELWPFWEDRGRWAVESQLVREMVHQQLMVENITHQIEHLYQTAMFEKAVAKKKVTIADSAPALTAIE